MPDTCAPTPKRVEKCNVSAKGAEYLFSDPTPNSLVVEAASERARQQHPWFAPTDKEGKRLDLLGGKGFLSSNLQFRIANYPALMARYDFLKYSNFVEFSDSLPQQEQGLFPSFGR